MQEIGILGGTFDPIHWGHLLLAKIAMTQGNLQQLIWVPMQQPPHKRTAQLTAFHHRVEMVRRAIATEPHYQVSRVETHRSGPSFAVLTLADLQTAFPQQQWAWVLGWDAFQSLPQWYRASDLAARCRWLVAPRAAMPDADHIAAVVQSIQSKLQLQQLEWQLLSPLPAPQADLSSRQVRSVLSDRAAHPNLVPSSVQDYILQHDLYGPE